MLAMIPAFSHAPFWTVISRFGEAQILLPAMLVMVLWLLAVRASRLAGVWIACTAAAAALTTVTKVAFLGWGVGYAPLDFTGISGHSMFAAAILPVLMLCLAAPAPRAWQDLALALGGVFALLVGASRVTTGAHSVSEAAIGLALGAAVSAWTVARAPQPAPTGFPAARQALVVALALWLVAGPAAAPPPITHDLVTRLSLTLSGRDRPYTRNGMLRQYRSNPRRQLREPEIPARPVPAPVQADCACCGGRV
jgi:membrane-associated phospholipid phosphatase